MQNSINQKTITLFRSLTIFQLIVLGFAYMQPLVVLDTFGIVSQKTNGHVTGAYLIATICLLFTALSYGKMSNRYPSSGSAYTYVQKTIGPNFGFLVGWTSLVDYLFMPLICVIQGKVYLASIFPHIDPLIFVVIITLIITIPNIIGIKLVANINTLIVLLQIFILAVFILLMLDFIYSNPPLRPEVLSAHTNWIQPDFSKTNFFSLNPFFSNESKLMPLLSGAGLLCFSFLGFDSLSNFAEEAKDPKKLFLEEYF